MSEKPKDPWRLTLYIKTEEQEMLHEMATTADRSLSYIVAKAIRHYHENGVGWRVKP
jgi:hypothetical protein